MVMAVPVPAQDPSSLLFPHQELAIEMMSEYFLTLWAGGIAAGKTLGAWLAMQFQTYKNPRETYLVIGKTQGAAVANVLPEARKALRAVGDEFHWNASKGILTLSNGATVEFIGSHTREALEKLQGRNVAGAMLDEFPLLSQSMFEMAIMRVRRGPHPAIIATMNKQVPTTHWAYAKYWDMADEKGYCRIDSPAGNPFVDISGAANSLTGAAYARFILNEWTASTGLCYPNYDVCDPIRREEIKRLEIAVDFGMSNPTAALYIANHDTIVGEYYSKDAPRVSDHAEAIMARAAVVADCPVWRAIIDPSAVALRKELERHTSVLNANNKVLDGIQETRRRLESGGIRIARGAAPELEREMSTYAWDEAAQERGEDKPVKADDHACDALRYYCATSPPPAGAGGRAIYAPPIGSFQWGAPGIGGR